MATGRATREALLSEAGFEKGFPDPELGPSEQAVFVDDYFVSCWGKRGAYRLLLELEPT